MKPNAIDRLLDKLFDGTLSEAEGRELEGVLSADREARRAYFEYVNVHLAITERGELEHDTAGSASEALAEALQDSLGSAVAARAPLSGAPLSGAPAGGGGGGGGWGWASSVLPLSCLVAFALGLLTVVYWSGPERAPRAGGGVPAGAGDRASVYIAEVGSMSPDAAWGADSTDQEFLLRLRAGDRLELERGLVSLDYYSGATLILRGPCVFTPTGPESGMLSRGEATGRVSDSHFLLTTPTARVLDLGTEFGVSVDDLENTEVCVFEGKVELTAGEGSDPMLLTVGMAARATSSGEIATDVEIEESRFARSIPLPPSLVERGELSLVDIMSGYEQRGYRLALGVAPDSGEAYQESWLATHKAYPRESLGVYHITGWHPMIDGVFIPPRHSRSVQIDSRGGSARLPPNGGRTSGPIWSRRRVDDPTRIVFHEDFGGGQTLKRVLRRLRACDWGMIGIHANVGVTFDLRAIREHYGRAPVRFRTIVANLDNSDEYDDRHEHELRHVADFRLFVDGELRASRFNFGRTDGDMTISVPISDTDSFLTVVTTDAGHYWFDQVVLIDPTLKLDSSE